VIATLANAGHSVSWCERCWRDVQAVRSGIGVAPLDWWRISTGPEIKLDRPREGIAAA
jgi:hypothetical protein